MHFNGIYNNTILNNSSLNQDLLNIKKKYKSNPLPWNGQFSPQLVNVLLDEYSTNKDVLYDPFLGSGTSLLESGEYGIKAYGTEINYAAVCLSKIYELINIEFSDRIIILNNIENILIEYGLIYQTELFKKIEKIKPIIALENILESLKEKHEKIIIEAFIILVDLFKGNFTSNWLEQKWNKIKNIVKSLPVSNKEIIVMNEDARETTLNNSCASIVITSPPYINVFNYHQQYRKSSEYLNGSVLFSAQAEIGSNRKHRSNRFYTVIQYCLDMEMIFKEINRICEANSRIIFIVGRESSVKKTRFYNGEIVSEIANRINGMDLMLRQERVFINRFGLSIYEDILHLSSNKMYDQNNGNKLRALILEILESVIKYTPEESKKDLYDAINKIDQIECSPIYKNNFVRSK